MKATLAGDAVFIIERNAAYDTYDNNLPGIGADSVRCFSGRNIIPKNFSDMRLEMTPALQERFPVMEQVLLKELERLNHYPERI